MVSGHRGYLLNPWNFLVVALVFDKGVNDVEATSVLGSSLHREWESMDLKSRGGRKGGRLGWVPLTRTPHGFTSSFLSFTLWGTPPTIFHRVRVPSRVSEVFR